MHPIPTGWAELNHMHRALLGVKSDLEASKKRADEERSLLKETVQSMPIGVVILDPQGNVLVVNAKASELWGTDQLQHFDDFKRITRRRLDGSAYPADHWPIMRALYKGALVQNEEVIHVQPDGSERRLCINAAPVRNSSGSTIASVAAFYDTTDLHAALDQHKLLLEEINHRVNNTMATIQAIATLTRPGVSSVGEYVTAFQKRLMALAHAYRLLTDNNWQGADLCEISKGILAPYGNEQVDFDGPRVQLAAVHTLAIAAALQELATNAAKYGSLSVPSGRLNLRWRVENDQLHLHWQESGGPVVVEPTRRGFGSRFIQETLKKQVDWDVEVEYASEGLKFNLSLKLDLPAVQKASAA